MVNGAATKADTANLSRVAQDYIDLGLCALPANREQKRPIGEWKSYQTKLPPADDWNHRANAICVITGGVSGNLELIDFDYHAESFEPWHRPVQQAAPGLFERLVVEKSQSGGMHVFYRCPGTTIDGNQKLAKKIITTLNGDETTYAGKQVKPRRVGGEWLGEICLIETRGEGGLVLCAPSPGYEFVQGSFDELPLITADERELLLDVARSLNEVHKQAKAPSKPSKASRDAQAGRPGDDYNARGDFLALLEAEGWVPIRDDGENQLWRRPGKTGFHWSASLKGKKFYVHSSNAAPFEPETCYDPFAIYALLKHNGDYSAAAAALRDAGFGAEHKPASRLNESEHRSNGDNFLEAQLLDLKPVRNAKRAPPPPDTQPKIDPGIYSMPGFIDELMGYTLATAPYPSAPLAFCGALSLLATLVGRKVRGPTGLATNLYVLGLANSGSGKEHPRQVNSRILSQIGLADRLTGRVASGQGLEEAVYRQNCLLMQLDEFDSVMMAINRPGDAIGAELGARLMELYSASQGDYFLRVKAQDERPRQIVRPHLSMFATAVPLSFYQNLTSKVLANGLVARMLIVESGQRGRGQKILTRQIPERIIHAAEFWRDFNPAGKGEFTGKDPRVIEYDEEAQAVFVDRAIKADDEYDRCHAAGDNNGCAIWARAIEQAHKLAVLYAISEDQAKLVVGEEAAMWATSFTEVHARWLLSQVERSSGGETRLEEIIRRVLQRIKRHGGKLDWSECLKASRVKSNEFKDIAITMVERGQVIEEKDGRTAYLLTR